jgi:hypothetical protein
MAGRSEPKAMSLAELDRLRRAEQLGELEEVDDETSQELFLATMEEIATREGHANPWNDKEIDHAKAALEGSSRSGVLKAQRAERRGPAPVDNTQVLRRMAKEKEVAKEAGHSGARVGASSARTSVRFVGMSIDAMRKWLDQCRAAGCVEKTKASQIRLMAAHGLGVTLMAKVLGTTYQQVYQTARYQDPTAVDVPEADACRVCFRRRHASHNGA